MSQEEVLRERMKVASAWQARTNASRPEVVDAMAKLAGRLPYEEILRLSDVELVARASRYSRGGS